MKALSHLVGSKLTEAIDEIEMFAVLERHWLRVVTPNDCLERKKLNVCVDLEGTIMEFVLTQ
jgi:hypothetical protein